MISLLDCFLILIDETIKVVIHSRPTFFSFFFSSCLTLWLELILNSDHPHGNRENGSTDRQSLITLLCCESICSPVSSKYFQHGILQKS